MKNFCRKTFFASIASVAFFALVPYAHAARFIAIPTAETLPTGRISLWQFGLYEKRGTKDWRSLNRLDLGLADGLEFGLFVINPKDKPSDAWVNLEYRPFKEKGLLPHAAFGVWDAARKGDWFSHRNSGPSPFISLSKTFSRGGRYLKTGASYGFNRLNGFFGGAELRFLKDSGLFAEYAPKNLRLTKAGAFDIGVYRWLGKSWRARASWMGGNPMVDVFFTYLLGSK